MSKKAFLIFGILLFILPPRLLSLQRLPEAHAEDVGMSSQRLARLDDVIQEALEEKHFPGAVLVVGRRGRIVWRKAYGDRQWLPQRRPMELSLVFDLASLTKPIATTTSILLLVERGKIRLWDKVEDFVPRMTPYVSESGEPEEEMRLWHLLTHTSGLRPYFPNPEIKAHIGIPCALEDLVGMIATSEKLAPPGEDFVYSDLGFILLGHIVEEVSGESLAEFAFQNVFSYLKMDSTTFSPPAGLKTRCVPTEKVEGRLLQGVVHDPRARLLGGVAGHAGLFSCADDLSVFAQMLLNKGEYQGVRLLAPLTVERMTEIHGRVAFSGRGLGWDLDSGYSTNGGDLFGPHAFGHTGYTGTSFWIDPETETFVIFLTNRVHPDDTGEVATWRSRVANVVAAAILEK
jgi:CubicO group peptidase (beta-lactamase class C family)